MSVHWGGKGPGHVSRWPRGVGAISPYSGATMLLDFLNPVLDPRITFSRGTGATRVNQSGFIETVGNDTPRFDYDPVTLAPRGLLIEEARTNLLTYSQDWTNAAWSKANITVTAAATASPDGTVNAQRLQATATAVTNNVSPSAVVAATAASFSVYVKQGTGATTANRFALRNVTTATTLILGTLNYSTGVFTYSVGSTGVTAINVGNGWWRLVVTATSGITSGDSLAGYVGFVGGAQTAGDHLFAYGAQLEAGSFATSYIPTVASTVTRSADVATMTGTNFSSWYNQSEGTIVAETALIAKSAASYGIYAFDDGTTNNAYPSFYSTGLQANSRVSGANVFTSSGTLSPISKSAFAYKIADYASSFNGASPTTQLSGAIPSGLNRLQIGAYNGFQTNGHIRTIAYFNTRAADFQLQALSALPIVDYFFLQTATGDQLVDGNGDELYSLPIFG